MRALLDVDLLSFLLWILVGLLFAFPVILVMSRLFKKTLMEHNTAVKGGMAAYEDLQRRYDNLVSIFGPPPSINIKE